MCRGSPGFVGPEAYRIFWGPLLEKKEYEIRYESEYLFRARHRAVEGP